MDSTLLLQSHVAISVVAILSGMVVLWELLRARIPGATTLIFLVTSVLTSATGFLFHRDHLLPSQIVGGVALVVLLPTLLALYAFRLRGAWRSIYVIGAIVSLWFNVFVLIAQAFQKVPALHELAPTGSEPAFGIAQGIVFVIFIALTVLAVRRNRAAMLLPVRI